jgi:alkaline phosphatase
MRILYFIIVALLLGCTSSSKKESQKTNVILLIGDGMGLVQAYSTYTYNGDSLNMFKFPIVGLLKTSSFSDYITDSGAGGTAIACGVKTYNGAIGVNSDTIPAKNLVELSMELGMKAAVISSSSITHATPAAFLSHNKTRKDDEGIAKDISKSGADIIIGGGRKYFINRSDSLNLIDSMTNEGYGFIKNISEISDVNNKILCLTEEMHNPFVIEGRGNLLAEGLQKSLSILSKDSRGGFFIMLEGSQIDWGGHANDAEKIITETLDFDEAVGVALEYAKKNANTLVIVTADHETGGMTIPVNNKDSIMQGVKFSTGHHTAVPVPVFAYGSYADEFTGIYENSELFERISSVIVRGQE